MASFCTGLFGQLYSKALINRDLVHAKKKLFLRSSRMDLSRTSEQMFPRMDVALG